MTYEQLFKRRNIWMGLAIIWIMLFHLGISKLGYAGTDIFFFASGIGVYFSYKKSDGLLSFYKKRFVRIMPMYFCFIGFFIFYRFLFTDFTVTAAIRNIIPIEIFFGFDNTFNWYITYLLIFYLLAPFIIRLFIRVRNERAIFGGILALILVFSLTLRVPTVTIGLSRLPIFCLGILFSLRGDGPEGGKRIISKTECVIWSILTVPALVLTYYFLLGGLKGWQSGLIWYPLFFFTPGFCIIISFISNGLAERFGEGVIKPLSFVGKYTLPLYLSHVFLFEAKESILMLPVVIVFAVFLVWAEKKISPLWGALLAVVLISSYPLFLSGIEGRFGQDLGFQLMRIEGLYTELKAGAFKSFNNFPIKTESLWMDGFGYPVSVYYGDFLLYIPAIFRMFGATVIKAYKGYVFLVSTLTAAISYRSFLYISDGITNKCVMQKSPKYPTQSHPLSFNRQIAAISAAAYLTAGYRLTNLYVRAAAGEYSAMIFLPMFAASIYAIYFVKREDMKKVNFPAATMLALSVTGIFGTHMLTVLLAAFSFVLFALIMFKRTIKADVLLTGAVAAVETALLNLYFIIPFLDYYKNVDMHINHVVSGKQGIGYLGSGLYRLVSFASVPFHPGDRSDLVLISPGATLLMALGAGFIFLILRRAQKGTLLMFVFASITLFLTTKYFPWDAFAGNAVGNIMSKIQFPWRWMSPAILFLSLLLAFLLEDLINYKHGVFKTAYIVAVLGIMISVLPFMYNYRNNAEFVDYKETKDLNTSDMGFIEYLRYGTERENLKNEIVAEDATAKQTGRNGTTLTFSYETGNVPGTVEVPIINIKGYHAVSSDGTEYEISDGKENVIRVSLPENKKETVTVFFKQPGIWVAGEIASLATLLIIAIIFIVSGAKRKPVGKALKGNSSVRTAS